MFLGREKELERLEEMCGSNRFELPIIYGRRRVGKTTLIRKFVEEKRHIFFTSIEGRRQDNLDYLKEVINQGEGQTKILGELTDFKTALEAILKISQEEDSPFIFVIDEYPYLANSDSSISSILQMFIDTHFLKESNLMVVLSGSSMSFMEKQVLGYESPLYGRRTGQFKVLPLSPWEARGFFPDYSKEDFLTVYGITGGIPLYLSLLNPEVTLKENICKSFFSRNTFLYEEPSNFLKQELRNPSNYFSVISAIANGHNKFNEINSKVMLSTSSLDKYIHDLIELGIIVKDRPLGNKQKNAIIYRLKDGLFRFWFSFVPPNLLLITDDKSELVWELVQEKLAMFTSKTFEEFCIQWLIRENGTGAFRTIITEIGSWWGRDPHNKSSNALHHEIDILGFGSQNDMVIGECKWTSKKVDYNTVELLNERSSFFSVGNQEKFIFSKSGFTKSCIENGDASQVKLIEFKDMII
jgi:AAA+ ATPase superfamily predicted ATPase